MVTIEEAKAQLEELIREARPGAEIVITSGADPVAKLLRTDVRTSPESNGWRAFGMLKGQVWIAEDFDEPLEEFREYME